MARGKTKKTKYFDYTLLFIMIFLICFGLVMLFSASSYTGANRYGNAAYFVKKQLGFSVAGFAVMMIIANIDYHIYRHLAALAYVGAFALCAAVMVPGLGDGSHGSVRWLIIGPIRFQPSEIAKIAVILFMAMLIERMPKKLNDWRNLVKILGMLVPIVGVVMISNLSTSIIILGIAVCMAFVASHVYKPFFILGGVGVAGIACLIPFVGYRMDRVKAWLHPEEVSGALTFQTLQGLYAIGSGGLFGKGLGESLQKKFVPEAQNDMIFTIICEELGLFGGVCMILLYGLLIWRMLVIANNARDLFGSMIAVGVMSHISLQVILNIAVATNSIPNTGVTLPFISYGGTSVMLLMAEMGLVLSVAKGIRLEKIE